MYKITIVVANNFKNPRDYCDKNGVFLQKL